MNARIKALAKNIPVIGGVERALLRVDESGVVRRVTAWESTAFTSLKDWYEHPEDGVESIEHMAREDMKTEGLNGAEVFRVHGDDWELLVAIREG